MALRASIAHWERLSRGVADDNEGIGPSACALCVLFLDSGCMGARSEREPAFNIVRRLRIPPSVKFIFLQTSALKHSATPPNRNCCSCVRCFQRRRPNMPKAKPEPKLPFVPVDDPAEVKQDPLVSRVLSLFDALRKRHVGPERAAYCCSQVFGSSANGGAHPAPQRQ